MELKKKMVLKNLGAQDRSKDADVENGLEDTGRGKGKLGRSESVAWTYTLPNVKQIASGKQLHSTGRSARCSVTT